MANTIRDSGGFKYIEMQNARFARKPIAEMFTDSSAWSKIRIALLLDMADSGANITSPKFYVGLCAGTTNIAGDASPTHFAGAIFNAATWTRATAPVRYFYGSSGCFPCVIIAGVSTIGVSSLQSANFPNINAAGSTPNAFFLDITKGSPNYTFQSFHLDQAAGANVTDAQFEAASLLGTPVLTNHTQGTARTQAVDEAANGTFDAICVAWDQASPVMKIRNMRVVRLA